MSAIYHIYPNYAGVTIWYAKREQRVRVVSPPIRTGLTRYARYVVISEIVQGAGLGIPDYVFARHDKHVENGVLLRSGFTGWRGRLRANYKGLKEFRAHCSVHGNHTRLGFNSPEEAWAGNPVIEGSVNPADYKLAKML